LLVGGSDVRLAAVQPPRVPVSIGSYFLFFGGVVNTERLAAGAGGATAGVSFVWRMVNRFDTVQ
jgi:hypothetical protein